MLHTRHKGRSTRILQRIFAWCGHISYIPTDEHQEPEKVLGNPVERMATRQGQSKAVTPRTLGQACGIKVRLATTVMYFTREGITFHPLECSQREKTLASTESDTVG